MRAAVDDVILAAVVVVVARDLDVDRIAAASGLVVFNAGNWTSSCYAPNAETHGMLVDAVTLAPGAPFILDASGSTTSNGRNRERLYPKAAVAAAFERATRRSHTLSCAKKLGEVERWKSEILFGVRRVPTPARRRLARQPEASLA